MITYDEPDPEENLVVDEGYIRDTVWGSHKRDGAVCSCGSRFPESLDEEKLEKLFASHLEYTVRNLLNVKAAK